MPQNNGQRNNLAVICKRTTVPTAIDAINFKKKEEKKDGGASMHAPLLILSNMLFMLSSMRAQICFSSFVHVSVSIFALHFMNECSMAQPVVNQHCHCKFTGVIGNFQRVSLKNVLVHLNDTNRHIYESSESLRHLMA